MATQWYYQDAGEERGPVPFRELVELVRSGTITESDLVRSSWKTDWQTADSVVGLFHMAGRSAEELARLNSPSPAPEPEPISPEPLVEVRTLGVDDPTERPGWMTRLFTLSGLRKPPPLEIPILGISAADANAGEAGQADAANGLSGQLSPALAAYSESSAAPRGDAWSGVVGEAVEHIDQRAAGLRPYVGRWGRLAQRIANLFAAVRGAGQSPWIRPAFRLVCAVVCANLVAFAVENWSAEEALRFPSREAVRGQDPSLRHFPLVGKCGSGEYLFLTFDLMLVTGAAAWFGARWLDSRAD